VRRLFWAPAASAVSVAAGCGAVNMPNSTRPESRNADVLADRYFRRAPRGAAEWRVASEEGCRGPQESLPWG